MASAENIPSVRRTVGRSVKIVATVLGICLCLLHPRAFFAQGVTSGTISGVVTDSTGAVVPETTVTVRNKDTGVSRAVSTNSLGIYTVPNLSVGTYSITVQKQGFKTEVRDNVVVGVSQTAVVNIRMSVGESTQSVTVQAQTVPITVDKAQRSVVIPNKMLEELPVQVSGSWRQDDTFLTLSPGVTGNSFAAKINGAPDMSEDFYYDGSPYMNADGGGRQEGQGPGLEAIDEYSEITNPYSAQYGRAVGLLNVHIRSGTNQLHGAAWAFVRNNAFDARGFFAPQAGTEKQNEYGFRVGGPVYIPKVYNGKDKTFFFFMLNWFKFRGGLSNSLITLPTEQMKNGDFSQLPFPIYDPATTRPDGHGGLTRDPFPGNIIPPSRESVLSAPYIALVPTATLPGVVNNALVSVPTAPQNYRQYLMKFDQNFSNNLLNQLAFSVQYTEGKRIFFPHVTTAPNSLATVGLPYPAFVVSGMPTFGVGANDNQISGGCWPCVYLGENLKWIKGRHQLSLGAELRWEDELDSFASNIGTYFFGNGTTTLPDSPNQATLGYGFASFFLGTPYQATRTTGAPPRLSQTRYDALYAEDDIHATKNLTLNLGLRWDVSLPVMDPHNEMSTFDPTVPNPGAGNLPGSLVYTGTSGGPCIAQGGASLCRKRIASTYWKMFQPRAGFAYSVNPKTVLRGGFGMFSIRGGASTLMGPEIAASFLTGFRNESDLLTPDGGFLPPVQLQPTWDVGIPPLPPLPPRTRTLANGQDVDFMQVVDGKPGYTMQWSFGIERELPWQVGLSASYVGSGSVRTGSNLLNENQVPTRWLSLGNELYDDISCLNDGTCPNAVAAGVKLPYPGFTGSVEQALRPFPQYLNIAANTQADGHATYHSLQVKAQKYFSHGVSFLVSYTWFKNLDNSNSQFSTFTGYPLYTYNQRLEKANDVSESGSAAGPQLLSIAGTYELPIGPGKTYLNQTGGVVGRILGGWNIAPVLSYVAGAYLGVIGGTPNPLFNGAPRPNRVPGVNPRSFTGGAFDPAVDYYLNPAAFSDAGAFTLGNAPRSLPDVRGFPYYNENLAFIKRTSITESTNIEFRAEFYNIFNRVQFCGPDGNWNDRVTGAFGKVGCQANQPRVIQFGLKFNF